LPKSFKRDFGHAFPARDGMSIKSIYTYRQFGTIRFHYHTVTKSNN